MPKYNNVVAEDDLEALRKGIKDKYNEYHVRDRIKFPDFEYNSNRANYQPLKDSFEEEFYVMRGIDRINNNIHIPSTNTLALLYSDVTYVPGKKIINTCYLYIEDKSEGTVEPEVSGIYPGSSRKNSLNNRVKANLVVLASLIVLIGIVISIYSLPKHTTPAIGLVINYPLNNQTVPRQLVAEGSVSNATTVWIVVHTAKSTRYWVQPEAKVDTEGRWKGHIYIGSENKEDIGIRAQIRAFVNPAKHLEEGEILYSWPKAQNSSKIIEVVRGPESSK